MQMNGHEQVCGGACAQEHARGWVHDDARDFPFQAVIFDMDGVLIDSEALYQDQLNAFVTYLGIEVSDAERASTVGSSHKEFQRLVARWLEEAGRGAFEPAEAECEFDTWARSLPSYSYADIMNPGVPETLAELKRRGVRCALASSSPIDNIHQVLDECGIAEFFEIVVSGDQFEHSKPAPDVYLHALARLGLPAEACCCVEDSFYGITAGKAAGLTVVAKREERFGFSQADADVIIDQIPDLLTCPLCV